MLDSNVFDRLDEDGETLNELSDRRDLILLATSVQRAELEAIGDEERRGRLLAILETLCKSLGVPAASNTAPGRHRHDAMIAQAARARCDVLVSDDLGLLERARSIGLRAMGWPAFRDGVVWRRR